MFARAPGESEYPNLWDGLQGLWCTSAPGAQTGARDYSPYGNDGTFAGVTTPIWTTGRSGEMAVDCTTSTTVGHVNIPTSTRYDNAQGTISLWFRVNAMPGAGQADVLAARTTNQSRSGFTLYIDETAAVVYECQSNTAKVASSSDSGSAPFPTATLGAWHHVALRWDQASGATNRIFFDGVEYSGSAIANSATWAFNGQAVRLADSLDTFWVKFDGWVHTVMWHGRHLSAGEIQDIHRRRASPLVPCRRPWLSLLDVDANAGGAAADAVPVCWAQYRRRRAG